MVETVALRKKISRPSVKKFVEECLASDITSPSEMRDAYKTQYKKELSASAFRMAADRLGVNSEQRKQRAAESQKQAEVKDISEYAEVKNYVSRSERSGITSVQLSRSLQQMRQLWEWMNGKDPWEWTEENIHECVKQHVPMIRDNRGRMQFEKPGKVRLLLSAFNTMFPGILAKGWYAGLTREPGELKDYFTFQEADDFLNALSETPQMSREGWLALFKTQLNMGCREGSGRSNTGILNLLWEDIDFERRRCQIREKGGKGKAGRIWKNVPLDLFPWLNGWNTLMTWWDRCGRPAVGKVFPVSYDHYNGQFHSTRRRCNGRIAGDKETLKPHVLRKTHAQWLVKLRVPLEQICGVFPNGWFGVGWQNPLILLRYYVTIEEDQVEETSVIMKRHMKKLGLAPLSAWEKSNVLETVAFIPRLEESHNLLCRNVE
jgi:integrase